MKKTFILALCICLQVVVLGNTKIHSIHPAAAQAALLTADDIIREIIRVVGLKANFEVRAAKIPNAAAVAYNGKRWILYNPEFFISLNKAAGNNWASVSVLAHEIGHHLNGHTMDHIGSQPAKELEADEFSGFVLRRMGASLEEAQVALKVAADYKPSATHPGKHTRLVAIADGWQNADNQVSGRNDVAVSPRETPAERTVAIAKPVIDPRYILGEVKFSSDEDMYYVTTRYNLVKVASNKLYIVGKVSSLNNRDFPYMIHDENKTFLLVDPKGIVYNKLGKVVGRMQAKKA